MTPQSRQRESGAGIGAFGLALLAIIGMYGCAAAPTDNDLRHRIHQNYLKDGALVERWGLIDNHGRVVLKPTYARIEAFSEGLAAVTFDDFKTRGYINLDGELVITLPEDAAEACSFSEGLALVNVGGTPGEIDDHTVRGGRWGYIDTKGRWAIEPIIELIHDPDGSTSWNRIYHNYIWSTGLFNNGRAAIPVKGGWGFINHKGELVIPGPYTRVEQFYAGQARVINRRVKRLAPNTTQSETTLDALINTAGEVVWQSDIAEDLLK